VVLGFTSCRRASPAHRASHPVASAANPALLAASAVARTLSVSPKATALPAPNEPAKSDGSSAIAGCAAQAAQPFLIDAHLHMQAMSSTRGQLEWWAALQKSIRYRTEEYGYYSGFGSRAWNPRPLGSQLRAVKFMGIPTLLHERVIPALRCVELALARECKDHPYRPRLLAGARRTNTYFGGDVTNHVYGIALDIDPQDNPCCNCVEPWRSNPRCRGKKTDLERMAMPACWISTFERYGFYWLGHDELKDSMHFEFLGDPSKIASSRSQ
jgi:hypothetical protein